eukprot:312099-Prymnesium_polylepis.1
MLASLTADEEHVADDAAVVGRCPTTQTMSAPTRARRLFSSPGAARHVWDRLRSTARRALHVGRSTAYPQHAYVDATELAHTGHHPAPL